MRLLPAGPAAARVGLAPAAGPAVGCPCMGKKARARVRKPPKHRRSEASETKRVLQKRILDTPVEGLIETVCKVVDNDCANLVQVQLDSLSAEVVSTDRKYKLQVCKVLTTLLSLDQLELVIAELDRRNDQGIDVDTEEEQSGDY